jgi:penicillin amidase
MHRNAPEPLIMQAWIWALGQAILADELGPDYVEFLDSGSYTIERLVANESIWCDDVTTSERESCDIQIERSLETALDYLSNRFGNDTASWRWGEAHAVRFDHPLLSRIPVLRTFLTYSVEADGGHDTINRGSPRLGGSSESLFEDVHGAGFRAVFDLADLNRSRFMIATGQSGNPLSSSYGNLAQRWRDGHTLSLAPESWTVAEQLSLLPAQE